MGNFQTTASHNRTVRVGARHLASATGHKRAAVKGCLK